MQRGVLGRCAHVLLLLYLLLVRVDLVLDPVLYALLQAFILLQHRFVLGFTTREIWLLLLLTFGCTSSDGLGSGSSSASWLL